MVVVHRFIVIAPSLNHRIGTSSHYWRKPRWCDVWFWTTLTYLDYIDFHGIRIRRYYGILMGPCSALSRHAPFRFASIVRWCDSAMTIKHWCDDLSDHAMARWSDSAVTLWYSSGDAILYRAIAGSLSRHRQLTILLMRNWKKRDDARHWVQNRFNIRNRSNSWFVKLVCLIMIRYYKLTIYFLPDNINI